MRRALSASALEEVTEGLVGIAQSEQIRHRLWPDPQLSFNREGIRGTEGAVQDFVMISQAFDFSGRRGLSHRAAGLRVQAVKDQNEAYLKGVETSTRLSFHELLSTQLRLETIESWMERIEQALLIVTQREEAGDASSYERRQVERELANTRLRLAIHQAEGGRAWERLAALIGESHPETGPPSLLGKLLPEESRPSEQLASGVQRRPDIAALGALEEAAQIDSKAAARWWVPKPTLGLGWTGLEVGTQSDDGYLAMVTLSLPLFQRGQAESLKADSEARLARGRRELALTQALGEVRILTAELHRLIAVAKRHRLEVVDRSNALIRSAEAGYSGGELRILELLDAYRGAIDDELTTLDLELAARRAHIDLLRASGGDPS